MTHFDSLGLSRPLLDVIAAEGYDTPTPIQARSIPPVLAGRDLLGCAQTGTGKTAAFALPVLDRLHSNATRLQRGQRLKPRALVLSPTRELAGQIEESMRVYGRHTRLRHAVIYGGVKQGRQVRQLQAGVDIIVATPGRLLDLLEQGHVDLSAIEIFVLDEADRMLDMGFIQPIRTIAQTIPAERQTLMFSATMPPNIKKLANALLENPERVTIQPDVSAAPSIEQSVYKVSLEDKPTLLRHLLDDDGVERAVVFTRTKHGADKLAKRLSHEGARAGAIHGNKSQSQRERVLEAFRKGKCRVLIATDVAARGLDVDGVTHVFNFSLPDEPESYVHRIGRTGRAGATGQAITLCSREERGTLRTIERIIGEPIDVRTMPDSLGIQAERAPARDESSTRRSPPKGHGGRNKRKPNTKTNAARHPFAEHTPRRGKKKAGHKHAGAKQSRPMRSR
ncbi:MAG: DEAD/DEAH box helicase [Planctomycetota bacterium]